MKLWGVKFRQFDGIWKVEFYYSCPTVCKVEYCSAKKTGYGYEMRPIFNPKRLVRVCGYLPHIYGEYEL